MAFLQRLALFLRQLYVHDLSHVAVVGHSVGLVDVVVLLKETLQRLVGLQIAFLQPQDLKCLLLGDKSTFDAKPLLSHLLAALVSEFLSAEVLLLALEKLEDLLVALGKGERSDGNLVGVLVIRALILHVSVFILFGS